MGGEGILMGKNHFQRSQKTAQEEGIADDGVKCVDESTVEEKRKLVLMRATVEKQDLTSKVSITP